MGTEERGVIVVDVGLATVSGGGGLAAPLVERRILVVSVTQFQPRRAVRRGSRDGQSCP